ncbi:formate dehydrogenase accessory protein FdhE [Pseudomonas sp. R1-18]
MNNSGAFVEHTFGNAPSGLLEAPHVMLPSANVFSQRALRLRELVKQVPELDEFLAFMARLVQVQDQVLGSVKPGWQPAEGAFDQALEHGMPALGFEVLSRVVDWQADLIAILDALDLHVGQAQRPLLSALREATPDMLKGIADDVLHGRPGEPDHRGLMPLVAAALQVAWVRLALRLPGTPRRPAREAQGLCPTCGSAPVASLIHNEQPCSGVRYLYCGLCSTQWHLERVRCSVCDHGGDLLYLGLDNDEGKPYLPVQAEACGHCQHYLKLMQRQLHGRAEPIADDLASLALDFVLAEQGTYQRSGYNPLFIAGE